MPQTYAYNPRNGVYYAKAFALIDDIPEDRRLFYYNPERDCTNFISQCVWAAYGGWLSGFSAETTAENARRILKDVRQVRGVWYGSKRHIGSPRWCRVEEFFSFVTSSRRTLGPQARLIADGSFESVSPGIVRAGDVIQMVVTSYAPGRFGHGLYVTSEGAGWDTVRICCHTYNRLDAPMTEFAAYPEIYPRLRVLRFFPAAFDG